jgi:hypothetical protein
MPTGFDRKPGGATRIDGAYTGAAPSAPGKQTRTDILSSEIMRNAASDAEVSGAAAQAQADPADGENGGPRPGD